MKFTEEQKKIFEFIEKGIGHGIIDAVAGAGKTTTIMECAKYIKNKSSILFCAFNNSIAKEIAHKFHKIGLDQVTVKTVHALGRQILDDNNQSGNPIRLEEKKYIKLYETKEIQEAIRPYLEKICEIHGFDIDNLEENEVYAINNLIQTVKFKLLEINQKFRATLTKEDLADFENLVIHFGIFNDIEIKKKFFKEEVRTYFRCHQILLEAANLLSKKTMVIDYTDMIYLPYKWNLQPIKKFDFLFIDECQDLSKAQFAVVAKYGRKDSRILAVGDPYQSIYGFAGADINSFYRIKEYTKATQLPLNICFRCPQKVIEMAKSIRNDIVGNKQENGIIKTITYDELIELVKPNDLIISRKRAPIILLVFKFIDKNIKVQIHQDEVLEIINDIKNYFKQEELQLVISKQPNGFEDIKNNVLKRWKWIIEKNAERITDSAERNLLIQQEKNHMDKVLDFLHKKYEKWKSDCKTINDILKKIVEYISSTDNSIKLSTIHRAKGIESYRVFILNYDELPYIRTDFKEWQCKQEINLKYVAITRAINELYLVENKNFDDMVEEESLFDNLPFDQSI